MLSEDFLREINKHMARGNELMAEIREQNARGNELMAEVRREHKLNREAYRQGMDLHVHLIERIDAMFRRNSKVMASQERAMARQASAIERLEEKIEKGAETIKRNLEMAEALRDSVLAFMDRLDQSGGPAAA